MPSVALHKSLHRSRSGCMQCGCRGKTRVISDPLHGMQVGPFASGCVVGHDMCCLLIGVYVALAYSKTSPTLKPVECHCRRTRAPRNPSKSRRCVAPFLNLATWPLSDLHMSFSQPQQSDVAAPSRESSEDR